MAKGKCCGEPQLPKTLSNTTLIDPRIINPEFINATFTHDCSGRPVTEETPVVSCEDLANGAAVSDDKGNIITPGQDGGAYLGISDTANNVTKLDGKGKLYTPISNQVGNLTKKGTDGGIFTGISGDSGNIASRGSDGGVMVAATKVVTAIKGCDGRNHTTGTTIPSCAQMNAAVSSATSEAAVVSKLKGCDGRNHPSGTTIPSCAQMNAAIAAAIRGLNLANLISKDAGNGLTLGSDGKLFVAKSSGGGSSLSLDSYQVSSGAGHSTILYLTVSGAPGQYSYSFGPNPENGEFYKYPFTVPASGNANVRVGGTPSASGGGFDRLYVFDKDGNQVGHVIYEKDNSDGRTGA